MSQTIKVFRNKPNLLFKIRPTIYYYLHNVHLRIAVGRSGVEVAGWTVDWEVCLRFPAHPHRV